MPTVVPAGTTSEKRSRMGGPRGEYAKVTESKTTSPLARLPLAAKCFGFGGETIMVSPSRSAKTRSAAAFDRSNESSTSPSRVMGHRVRSMSIEIIASSPAVMWSRVPRFEIDQYMPTMSTPA
eukprot:Amastigsp_a678444_12.p6 type:complete len:123 gc:universal Amastigsp_a678444_12:726-1094(+)